MQQRGKDILSAIWHWVSSRELLTYLMFVVLATFFWYGHALTSVRSARIPVRIVYTNIPGNIAFRQPLPESITIEVRDAGRRLMVYHRDPLQLTISLSGMFHSKEGEIRIGEDVLRRSITDLMQGTSKLQQIVPEHITGNYYTQQERTVPIQLAGTFTPDAEYLFAQQPTLTHTTVRIYGSREDVQAVDAILTEDIQLLNIKDTVQQTLRLVVPEHIHIVEDTVGIYIPVVRFTEKVMTIPITPVGVPEGENLRLFPQEVIVTARVSVTHFAQISAEHFKVNCHYPKPGQTEIPVTLQYKNKHIYGARVNPSNVEFIIEQ